MKEEAIDPKLEELIIQRNDQALIEELANCQPNEVAEIIDYFEDEQDQFFIFNILPFPRDAKVFEFLDFSLQKQFLESLSYTRIASILNEMSPDDRTSLLEELPAQSVNHLISLLSPKERQVALSLLSYPESSIGRLMTPDYIAVQASWTIRRVLEYIRKHGKNSETLNVIYVVDELGKLIDDIRAREFLLADPEKRVADLMDETFQSLSVLDDQEVVVAEFRKTNRIALPVIDTEGLLLGIVTIDDVLEVAQEESTEDIQKLGAVEALDNPYLDVPVISMIKKRSVWLIVLFLGEMLTATAMGYFEDAIDKAVVLALFVPLIISSGGNTGSQAATLIIRAMALGEVTIADWWRVMKREIMSGLALGGILGILGFARVALWSAFSDFYGPYWFLIALTIGFSLVGIVLWGTLSGSMLPLVLKRFGLDPATSSAPFVATLVDVTGVFIYFTFAVLLLTGTIL